ncbi:MAG: helix-turn-helix transcriptional regulator [Oscillospiraceae bacterium]|nr:helix-turn-helix transcriptional regulator [Oscillospiraceae bacterium]
MDLVKTGKFLQELRKEKSITQEQLSEKLGVSRRTVSRWETGNNMPDIDILIELADLYEVDLREILNGERTVIMEKEIRETALMTEEYSNERSRRSTRFVQVYFIPGIIGLFAFLILSNMELPDTFITGFFKGLTFSMPLTAMLLGLLHTTGSMGRIEAFKMRLLKGEEEKR